jgi:hypothetical protein
VEQIRDDIDNHLLGYLLGSVGLSQQPELVEVVFSACVLAVEETDGEQLSRAPVGSIVSEVFIGLYLAC